MKARTIFLLGGLLACMPSVAYAHGFGQRIDLPIPLQLYMIGGAATVVVSFLLISLLSKAKEEVRYRRIKVPFKSSLLTRVLKVFFVFAIFLVIAAGLVGAQGAAFNIAPTAVWILFGVGMTYFSAFVGNLWEVVNPWGTIFAWFKRNRPWPKNFGVWPAFFLFFTYRWIENVYPHASRPASLSFIILIYGIISFVGIYIFGKDTWFRYGDPFNVFFRFLSRFSVTEGSGGHVFVRPPVVGILTKQAAGPSEMIFVLFMLASIAFDGAKVTPAWYSVSSLFTKLGTPVLLVQTGGLVFVLLAFLVVYLLFTWLVKKFSRGPQSVAELAYRFVFSLLPIAIAYEVAHFITLFFIEGQRIIYLVSDPFGFGWNLFGTADYAINYQIINLKNLWHWQVALIVAGHIVAVYVAHVLAMQTFGQRKEAMRSQYPMLVLMVIYTVTSLWIIAQPILVGGG
ncbi:hypothetical protein HY086_05685 [Candidatus Gottesmanbacteria bacterium]|nr:hypothetical protein [Candidatus Gottesmanbacteria bacterium]